MQATQTSSANRAGATALRPCKERWLVRCLFFAGVFAYVWLLVKPRLLYDAYGIYLPYPEFALDCACFQDALSRVGGLVEYVSAFLSQWFAVPVVGALIVSATAALICLGTDRILREAGGRHAWLVCLLPGIAVLALYQAYHHPLAGLLALATCLWLAVACQTIVDHVRAEGAGRARAAWRLAPWRPLAFVAMCLGLYYLAGTVCVLFGLLVGTWLGFAKRRVVAAAGAILVSAATPWFVGGTLFCMTTAEAYSVVWPFGAGLASDMEPSALVVLRGLFLFPLLVLWMAVLCRALPSALQDGLLGFVGCVGPAVRVIAELVLLAAAIAGVHQFLRAPHREIRLQMVQSAIQREWDRVVDAARQLRGSRHDCFSRHLVDRALYHTGRLGDELFSFSQDEAALLLMNASVPEGPPKFWMLSEVAWELGDLNVAEQWAFERLEAVGECPSALELLAQVCLAKHPCDGQSAGAGPYGGREAARVVLKRMKKNVICGRRAQTLLELLDSDSPQGDPWLQEVERARARRRADDGVFQTNSEEAMLKGLLQANPRNKMAFDYLMAFYLVSRRTDKLVEQLPRLDDFGCREIPRHYEEAILIHAHETSQQSPLRGREIRPETVRRFRAFIERVAPLQDQPRRAMETLAAEFGDSYFYYYAFGISGTGGPR